MTGSLPGGLAAGPGVAGSGVAGPRVAGPRVALAHDYLAVQGGAERVVESLLRVFPGAPLHTSVYRPDALFAGLADPSLDIRPSVLNRVGLLRRHYRLAMPVLPYVMSRTVVDADVVVCSSSGWAHGVSTSGRKVVYCHNPARWLYQPDVYLSLRRPSWWMAAKAMTGYLRRWDSEQARSCDRYLANSRVVAERVQRAYGIDAEVLPPPSSLDPDGPQDPLPLEPGFVLCVGRLLPYKHVDAVIEAMRGERARRLVVVGDGPERGSLARNLPPNVTLLSGVSDAQLRWLYAHAACLVAASEEDFGLTPVEANMFGTPSIVLRYGGFLDTMIDGETALFFERPEPEAIRAALRRFDAESFDADRIRAHGATFSEARFAARLHAVVAEVHGRAVRATRTALAHPVAPVMAAPAAPASPSDDVAESSPRSASA